MTLAAALIGFGAVLVYSAWKNKSIAEALSEPQASAAAGDATDPASAASGALGPSAAAGAAGVSGKIGGLTSIAGTESMGSKAGHQLLLSLATIAQNRFNLKVREFEPFDHVDPVHVPNSLHYKNAAFDASGSVKNMLAFAEYVERTYGKVINELFFKGGGRTILIKNGSRLDPVANAALATAHMNHVHVGKL